MVNAKMSVSKVSEGNVSGGVYTKNKQTRKNRFFYPALFLFSVFFLYIFSCLLIKNVSCTSPGQKILSTVKQIKGNAKNFLSNVTSKLSCGDKKKASDAGGNIGIPQIPSTIIRPTAEEIDVPDHIEEQGYAESTDGEDEDEKISNKWTNEELLQSMRDTIEKFRRIHLARKIEDMGNRLLATKVTSLESIDWQAVDEYIDKCIINYASEETLSDAVMEASRLVTNDRYTNVQQHALAKAYNLIFSKQKSRMAEAANNSRPLTNGQVAALCGMCAMFFSIPFAAYLSSSIIAALHDFVVPSTSESPKGEEKEHDPDFDEFASGDEMLAEEITETPESAPSSAFAGYFEKLTSLFNLGSATHAEPDADTPAETSVDTPPVETSVDTPPVETSVDTPPVETSVDTPPVEVAKAQPQTTDGSANDEMAKQLADGFVEKLNSNGFLNQLRDQITQSYLELPDKTKQA